MKSCPRWRPSTPPSASPSGCLAAWAVDFLVGRFTRPHGDIDLNTYIEYRPQITRELNEIGFYSHDTGWLTHWHRQPCSWHLEIIFLERAPFNSGTLVIEALDATGKPGRYPLLPGYLDPERFATLNGVSFRVCSPAGEWLARAPGHAVIDGRPPDPKIEHDRLLLEELLTPEELASLQKIIRPPRRAVTDPLSGLNGI